MCFTSTLYINEKSVECNMLVKIMWCFLKIVFNDVEPKMNDTKLKAIADNMEAFISGRIDLYKMKKNCNKYIQQYDYKKVLSIDLFKEIGLYK